MIPSMSSKKFCRKISHEYVRSCINLKYCMMGNCVMQLRFTHVDPLSSRDFVTFVFASTTSMCNELQLSIVNSF